MYSIVKYQPSEYGSYRFPAWAELLGILMGLLSCLMIPAGMLVAVLREEGSLWEVSLPFLPTYSLPALRPSPRCYKTTCADILSRAWWDSCSLQRPMWSRFTWDWDHDLNLISHGAVVLGLKRRMNPKTTDDSVGVRT